MKRRSFITTGALAAGAAAARTAWSSGFKAAEISFVTASLDLNRHRFGVNYTPSRNWWFCWNDWDAASIERDLDAIAGLGADHLRIMLVWPFFQPNPNWVSPLHLERLDQLLTLMGKRNLDALVTVFTGQLSGWFFLPPYNRLSDGFYTDKLMWDAEELFVRELGRTLKPHENVIGFDFGNELNTCWQAKTQDGDAWMAKMFALMSEVLPDKLHVNGVDHHPWFEIDTFSPEALAAAQFPVMHCYPHWTGAEKHGGPMDAPSVKLMAGMAALIRSYARKSDKPVWAGEFNTCILDLPEKGQAAWLEKAVTVAIEQGVSWFSYWDTHDVDRKFKFDPVEYTLGLMTNDGRVKEQGKVFRQLAEAYRGKQVVYPKSSPPEPPVERSMDGTWKWLLDWMGWKRQ